MDETKEVMNTNNLTSAEKRKKWFEWLGTIYDWMKLPFQMLITILLVFAAYLMQQSLYKLSGDMFLSLLAPAFSEFGLLAAHFASDRPKNSVAQREMAVRLRWFHIAMSFILLVLNLIVETSKEVVTTAKSISKYATLFDADNIIYVILGILGVIFITDIITFFRYQDADDGILVRSKYAKKLAQIQQDSLEKELDSKARAEKYRADAKAKYWEEHSQEEAETLGRIEAAAEIKEAYKKKNITESEVMKYTGSGKKTEEKEIPQQPQSDKRPYQQNGYWTKEAIAKRKAEKESQSKETPANFSEEGEILTEEEKSQMEKLRQN